PGRNPKHSLRLIFRDLYGAGKLDYPFFGDAATDEFDTIVLRSNSQDAWVYNTSSNRAGTFARDQWLHETQTAMGQPAVAANYVHLYINGLYWGVYNPSERPDGSFAAARFGGDKEDYDALKNHEEVLDGNGDAYDQLLGLIQNDPNNFGTGYRDLSGDAAYQEVLQYVDAQNLADYMIHNMYAAAIDWPGNNYIARNRVTGEGFKFFDWDGEHAFKPSVSTDRTGPHSRDADSPTKFHHALSSNAEYRLLFADRLHSAFAPGGALYVNPQHPQWDPVHPEWNVPAARWMAIAEQIDQALIAEAARWGDYARDFYGVGQLYTPHDQLLAVRNDLLDNWFPQRSQIVFDQFDARGLYPAIDAPLFEINGVPQRGGAILPGDLLEMTVAQGTAYYTLDGADPRLPGGAINLASAVAYSSPVTLQQSTPVLARVLAGGQWSALNEATYHTPAGPSLAVTEINYHPHDPTPGEKAAGFGAAELFEFVELRNVGPDPVSLTTVRFVDGIDFDFAGSEVTSLEPSQYVVVVKDRAAFEFRYGTGANVAEHFTGDLNNSGERIQLAHGGDVVFLDFRFNDAGAWPGRADGKGATLELIDPAAIPDSEPERTLYLEDGEHWQSSIAYGGTPGADAQAHLGVVINEVLSHTDFPDVDSIELFNPTGLPVEVAGWYLSDSWGWESNPDNGNYKKYRIPTATPAIQSGEYRVFTENDFNPTPLDQGPYDFALDGAHGDDVWLMRADGQGNLTHFGDHVEFGAQANGESWGRWPDGSGVIYPMTASTVLSGANSGPRLGSVIISEVHYHPHVPLPVPPAEPTLDAGDLEYVEIYNSASVPVDLTHWRLRKGIDFDFPVGTMLPARSTLVVVPFDLDEADKLSDFLAEYGLATAPLMLGGYSGQLSNGGERVQLQRPDEAPEGEPGFFPGLLEDEAIYDDALPWPGTADGLGDSLHRTAAATWGNDVTNWTAAAPSPGTVSLSTTPHVAGRHIFYNGSTFRAAAANAADDDAIATDKTALLPGDVADFSNYTSYVRGINGIMVDFADLPDGVTLGASDFEFRVGNDDTPVDWPVAPLPNEVTFHAGAGAGQSDRVTIVWPDGVIRNEWLEVTVLPAADVFYFGNAVAESGNSAAGAQVTTVDLLLARNNPRDGLTPAGVEFPYDYDRDGAVNATDVLLARNNQTNFLNAVNLIDLSGGAAEAPLAELAWLSDLDQPRRPAEKDAAAEAVDKLLATYWS
ncbi:MAG: lamin tail domain-containing protein, partial [Candidatus Nealsonbacteria bacterium]|nr:lamin tail domain-containing protein [Candidatus Nealsonbacteria bacterium]